MNHYQFITISPLTIKWSDAVQLRRTARRVWGGAGFDPALSVTETGGGVPFLEWNAEAYANSTDYSIENAKLVRRFPVYWVRFDVFNRAAFDAFCASHGVSGTLGAHVLVGRNGSVCFVTAFDFKGIEGAAPFDQRDIRALYERVFHDAGNLAALDAFVAGPVLRPFAGGGRVPAAAPREVATHLVTVCVDGGAAAARALAAVHAEEEGSGQSLVDQLAQSADTVDYLRFGWSYTTMVLKSHTKEILFVNLMIMMQCLWFAQKTLREELASFDYETPGIRSDRSVAVQLEALNIERTFAGNEVEDFRANLQPWLRSAYDYVHGNWGIGETHESIERIVGDLREYFERKLDVFENRQSKRQATVLFWIALLQMVALYEGVGAYFAFLQMSDVDTESIFHSAAVATAVIGSPFVLSGICLVAAYFYFRGDRGGD